MPQYQLWASSGTAGVYGRKERRRDTLPREGRDEESWKDPLEMLQECDKGLRVSPGDRATRRWEGRGKKLGCLEAAWQGETEGSVNKGPSQMAGSHYFIRQTILLLRKNVSLMINYVFQNIIKIQYLFFLDFQDYHLDTHYHKHLIYAGERIIALGIPGIFWYPSNKRRRPLTFSLRLILLTELMLQRGQGKKTRKISSLFSKAFVRQSPWIMNRPWSM